MAYVQRAMSVPGKPRSQAKGLVLVRVRKGQPLPKGLTVIRRAGLGDLGIAPLILAGAQKVGLVKSIGGAVKKVLGMGPDPQHHADRENHVATALQLARGGDLAAFLWLRQATGGFANKKFLIPVPPVPAIGFPGGILTGLGDKQAKKDANTAYQSVRALFPQVPEQGNVIGAAPVPALPPSVPATQPGEIVVQPDGTVTYPSSASSTGGGGAPASGSSGTTGTPVVQQAGMLSLDPKMIAAAVGLAAIALVVTKAADRPARRRRRR